MMCRSSKSIISDPSLTWVGSLTRVVLAVALASVGGGVLSAQDTSAPTASVKPTPTPRPEGYVRFWNMTTGQNAPQLQLMVADDKSLTVGTPGNVSAGYLAVDPGTYTFTIRKPNDPAGVIKRIPVVMRADVYVTLLAVADKDNKPDVQLIDDTVNPKTDDGLGKLVIRHFFPGASVTVGVGTQPSGPPLTFGETTNLGSLPLRGSVVNILATGLGPTSKLWNVNADFTNGSHHATLLVYPDPYGRFRPRLVYDGAPSASHPASPAASPGAAAVPRSP